MRFRKRAERRLRWLPKRRMVASPLSANVRRDAHHRTINDHEGREPRTPQMFDSCTNGARAAADAAVGAFEPELVEQAKRPVVHCGVQDADPRRGRCVQQAGEVGQLLRREGLYTSTRDTRLVTPPSAKHSCSDRPMTGHFRFGSKSPRSSSPNVTPAWADEAGVSPVVEACLGMSSARGPRCSCRGRSRSVVRV